ncbi:MAG: tRNA dihydrouridine synthase DusB [Oscillospiraceae bacterium]|jgi:tRNA-dihydrouridine synthase B|nr:tRNA dihydrouridine synthase DusB [Oscillospiraceae bacterium]
MIRIGDVTINSKLALAPMAGVTDLAFRTVCRELGAGLTYTEMVSAKALVYQDRKTRSLLQLGENEHPATAQIFGSDISCMADAAGKALEISKADIIDINMGCPVGKVVKNGEGSALMKDPDKAMKIIEAVVKAVSRPVTVKIRKGWDKGNVNAVEFAKMAEEAGVSAIAVHGRTRTQMYSGKADWDIIREVKKAVNVPVLANGDVFEAEDAVRILKYTGADMAMIARGAMGDPWLFEQAAALLNGEDVPKRPPIGNRAQTALRQFEIAAEQKGEKVACLEARKHYAWYLRGVPHGGYFKEKISKASKMEDLKEITKAIKKQGDGSSAF